MTTFLQQGAAEAASRVRERVGASLRLQTSESVQDIWVCFCFCFFLLESVWGAERVFVQGVSEGNRDTTSALC